MITMKESDFSRKLKTVPPSIFKQVARHDVHVGGRTGYDMYSVKRDVENDCLTLN